MASDNNTMDADLGGDSILISNLQLAHPVTYPNVWGIEKEQPALISVALSTRNGFASAADKDALDNSTIHYGELAKRIRRIGSDNEDGEILDHRTAMTLTHRICANMAQKDDNSFILARSEVALDFTKACMFADSAGILTTQTYDNDGNLKALSTKLGIKGIQVPTLIGVNGYERTGKQPVVASITIFIPTNTSIHGSVAIQSREFDLFRLERRIIEIIQATSFETLESLAVHTMEQLQICYTAELVAGSYISLKLEKPRAIAFAGAPAVGIRRGFG